MSVSLIIAFGFHTIEDYIHFCNFYDFNFEHLFIMQSHISIIENGSSGLHTSIA